jgi:hypothetical protein
MINESFDALKKIKPLMIDSNKVLHKKLDHSQRDSYKLERWRTEIAP